MKHENAGTLAAANPSIAEPADYRSYIDGWRGIAILLVMMVHTSQYCGNQGHGTFLLPWSERFFNSGARGVQLFFILSAFTLFNSSYRRFKIDENPRRDFYLRRAFRILPMWLIVVAIYRHLGDKPFSVALLNAGFLFGFVRFDKGLELVPGGWSLFVEETFYLMLPIIFGRLTSLRRASNFTVALMFLAMAWCALPYFHFPIPNGNDFTFLAPVNHWYFFGFGIILHYIVSSGSLSVGKGSAAWRWDVAALCLMPVFLTTYLSAIAAMFVFCILVSSQEGTAMNRLMNNALLRRFGVYCYSIYLFHFLVLRFMEPFMTAWSARLGIAQAAVEIRFLATFPLVAAACLLTGFLFFNLVEKPSVRLGKRVIARLGARERAADLLGGAAQETEAGETR
ncbi:acyltransferase [Geomonas terrae]|uniref:Acyltransferase n=1 Tax=Geomonas terrae TaxID=2562681 RepID=A0A4S1CFJ0_9BACT|nr:acyltransferase [Geomonas terrae]TGU72284.1 acyltransferase [Geomonas terrae]